MVRNGCLGLNEDGVVCWYNCFAKSSGQVIANGVWENEIPIGQALHQRGCAQSVSAVIGEVGFADGIAARNRSHQVVVNPYTAHCVVNCWVDTHGNLVGVLTGDVCVHVEEVAVFSADNIFAVTFDHRCEV